MVNFPIRQLASQGIIKDVDPFDLPMTAWSGGSNVRFTNNKAARSPVFRRMLNTTGTIAHPSGIIAIQQATGFDSMFVLGDDARAYQFIPGTSLTNVTEASGFTPQTGGGQFTQAVLGGVLYVNRETHAPRYWGPTSTAFAPLPNWTADSRCKVFRAYKDFLFALNVFEGGNWNGNMVKWSNATLYGQTPNTWDPTVTTNNLAGENVLEDLGSPIVDAAVLRDMLVIYGDRQVWACQFTTDISEVFTWTRLLDGPGIIGRNCAVEVEGLHYVFGSSDLYVHDGSGGAPKSIAEGRIREWVFNTMDASKAERFFVVHNPVLKEVLFCYVSNDVDTLFKSPTGCNKFVAFNYTNGTWGCGDLPNVSGAVLANTNPAATWAADTGTWATTGGAWADRGNNSKRNPLFTGDSLPGALSDPRIYALDPMDRNSRVSAVVDAEANGTAYLERVGIDLDGANLPLDVYKTVRRMLPLAFIFRSVPVTFQWGAAQTPSAAPNYGPAETFDPSSQYKVDTRQSGRYLSLKVSVQSLADFDFTGFDLDVVPGGKR